MAPPSNSCSPDLARLLPKEVYDHLIQTLRTALPPPASDASDDIASRDDAAIAHAASLQPGTAAEADLAANVVLSHAHAMNCLLMARKYDTSDYKLALKCSAQAAGMMRESRAMHALLLRVQAVRRKRQADPALAKADAETERRVLGLMQQAVADIAADAEKAALARRKRAELLHILGLPPENTTPPRRPGR